MKGMSKKNLQNIRRIFEEKTCTDLSAIQREPSFPVRKIWILAAAMVTCLALAAFAYPMFSSLDGDELSLSGSYAGNGIVHIRVENHSDKELKFQHQTKLMRWVTSEEIPRLEGKPVFENTEFAPHSEGIMTIDLSAAYDMQAIAENYNREEWFYLLLTNHNFLFGQDWMCSVHFGQKETEREQEKTAVSVLPEAVRNVEEELAFYFEKAYGDVLLAFNEANFQYQQKVEEILARFDGTVVPALGPVLMVGGPSEFLDPEPIMGKPPEGTIFDESIPGEQQYLLTGAEWSYTDAYGRMVATADEKAWVQTVTLPQHQGQTDGGVGLPLIFLFVYDAEQARPENHAFLYGKIHSFAELESCKVLEDGHYAIYDATELIYTDLDAYLDYFLSTRTDVYCDDQIRQRVQNAYDFYRNKENLRAMYTYLELP